MNTELVGFRNKYSRVLNDAAYRIHLSRNSNQFPDIDPIYECSSTNHVNISHK